MRIGASLVLAVGVLAGIGCGGERSRAAQDVLLTRSSEGNEGEMTAHIGGTLHVDLDTGCVLIDGHPVVWPPETTLRGEPAELRLPGDQTARSGDTVSGGGGLVPSAVLDTTRLRIHGDLTRAVRCAMKSDVLVFQAGGQDIVVSSKG
jgi:hypothetical protein